jgi:hypothetical protein
MAIDIRATVTCSLGTLISASLNDDYVQGSGLIKTRGSCEISGTITPAIGTAVTFSYTKGGVTRTVPRKLRVLSSFADPFRRTTKVELGCKLTYLQDLQEPINWEALDDPENVGLTEADTRIITAPIHASSVMDKCLTELGITASSNPLTNKFSIPEFDFGSGYVSVLSDLLVSESYCGHLDTNEVLQVFELDVAGGSGLVIDSSKIIDLGPIGVGQLPGEAVVVSYSTLQLKDPNDEANEQLLWESDSSSSRADVLITYTSASSGEPATAIYSGMEYTYTFTQYSRINGKEVVAYRKTEESRLPAAVAGSYYSQLLTNGVAVSGGSALANSSTESYYSYDKDGNETQVITYKYDNPLGVAGGTGLPLVFSGTDFVSLSPSFSSGKILVEKTIVTSVALADYVKRYTNISVAWHLTPGGQQAIAESAGSFTSSSQVVSFLNASLSGYLYHLKTIYDTSRRGLATAEGRPNTAELLNAANAKGGDPDNGYRTESSAELELALGSATAQRRIEFSLPYAPDDTFVKNAGPPVSYSAVPSDAAAKAARYGRAQNRLLLGNRNGMNIQLEPERLPPEPFAPIVVQADGLSALYRANGTSWTMDSNGILVSTDALFWGAVGGTGTFWFPVAPGITTLPTTPAVVDGEMTVSSVVPVWNETVKVNASAVLGLNVTSLPYALELLTTVPAVSTKLGLTAARIRKVAVPAAGVTVVAQVPKVSISAAVPPPAASVAVAAVAPAVAGGAAVSVPLSSIAVAALVPETVGRLKTQVLVPSADLSVAGETPAVSSGASVAVPAAGITVVGVAPVFGGNLGDEFGLTQLQGDDLLTLIL